MKIFLNNLPKKYFPIFVLLILILSVIPTLAADKVLFYHTDPAGTPLAMTDENGVVVWKAYYLPFGDAELVIQAIKNNEKFVGKEKDESGLYYFGARYLDDEIGRFTQPDPSGIAESDLMNPQRLNRYAYSLNNPYRYIDPDGKWPEQVHNAIISRAFSGSNYKLSSTAIAALQRGSAEADSGKYQDIVHSYMHAMRAPNQSAEVAAGLTVTFIMQKTNEYKSLMKEGKTEEAYEALGMAMHPLMDNTSPSHEDYQEWKLFPMIDVAIHKRREREAVFNSDPKYSEKSVDAIRRLYNEANR